MKSTKIVFILILSIFQFANISGQDTYLIYLHTDRSYYLPGESVLFKAYILNGPNNRSNQINDTLHVALIDQEELEVSSGIFPVNNSLITGNIELPVSLTEGNYILIAYTVSMKNISPERIFSRVIEIRKYVELDVITDLSLTDTLYGSGSLLTAKIRFSGKGNKPVPVSFGYQLTGTSGEMRSGKGKTDIEGKATLALQLPEFDDKEAIKLLLIASYKGTKTITGVVIPTKYNRNDKKTDADMSMPANDFKHLNILVKTDKLQYEQNDKVRLDISVTDDKGTPVMTNMSVSASNPIRNQLPAETDNIVNYANRKSNLPAADSNPDIRKYFTQSLLEIIQSPGKAFIVQEKNNPKKLHRRAETVQLKQDGYSSDRNIFDILMQIKPYYIIDGKITFSTVNSINNLDGALIIVDGVKMGTDASILNNIPVPDIARITASTNSMDIQRYSAMNNCGIIEISMKRTNEFLKNEETAAKGKSSMLFWGPEIITDSSGKVSVSFNNNNISDEVLVSVNGIAANGLYGSGSAQYTVK
jgi:hypothetical protein